MSWWATAFLAIIILAASNQKDVEYLAGVVLIVALLNFTSEL